MTCQLPRPTPQALFDRIAANFSSNVLGGTEIVPESLEWYVVSNDYAMAEEFYSISATEWRERDPRFACCDNLIAMADADGVYPRAAIAAQGYVKVSGVVGSIIPSKMEFVFSETKFKTVGTVPSIIPAEGFVVLQMKAIVPGSASNSNTATTGTLLTPATGLTKVVDRFGVAACGGQEAETCEQFRSRYIIRKKYQPRANAIWITEKIKEWPCVTRVAKREGSCCIALEDCNCGCSICVGKLEFYALFDDTFDCGLAPMNIISDLNTWLFGSTPGLGEGQVEIGVCGKIFQAYPAIVNVEVFADCRTPAQEREINAGIVEIFKNAIPSKTLRKREFELLLAQVMGVASDFGVQLTLTDTSGTVGFINSLGNFDPKCDYMPCVGAVTYGAIADFGNC